MNSKIKKFLLDAVNNHVFPGCCAAIIHNQTTEYYCVGNKATHPYQEANKIDTLYDLASLTKVVSTTPAVLKLIQKGFVHYETTVKSIIPQFQNNDITIFHLLTHTSGLPADLNWGIKANKEEMINDICQISHSVVPGKKVIYSDLGYILLGYLIEVLTSDNLRKVVDDEIFLPLNMQHTMYCPPESLKGKCAPTELSLHFNRMLRGEVHDRKAHLLNGIAGHAGLFSNVIDLEHYAQMILDYGKYKNQIFLEEQYINDMFTNFSPKQQIPRGVGFLTYASDSLFSPLNSTKTIAHTGFTGTSMLIDLENQVAIILLSNRVHPTRDNTKILNWRREFHDFVMKSI